MKRLGLFVGLMLLGSVIAAPTPAPVLNPGVVFQVETTFHDYAPPRVEEMEVLIEGPDVLMPMMGGGETGAMGRMIFRGKQGKHGTMVVVDDKKRTYFVIDDAVVRAMAGQGDAASQATEEALKNLTQEQREAIKKAQQQAGTGAVPGVMAPRSKPEVIMTGERGDRQGYPCVKYEVFQDGRKIREIWTTDWDNIDGGDEAADAFRGMGAFFEAIWKALPQLPGGGDPFGGQNPFDGMNYVNGFPVVSIGFDEDGTIEDEAILKGTRRQYIDPAVFMPSAGYKRMTMAGQ